MSKMAKNLDKDGLKSIAFKYDLFFIDIWGVIHDGVQLHENSIKALNELEKLNKEYVLLTNAPRPNETVSKYLKKMGLDEKKSNKVFTSGQAALNFFNKNLKNSKFYHIGPSKDYDLFDSFKKNKLSKINDADFLLCTGFFDDHEDDLQYYKNLLKNKTSIKMICTNPDLVIDRGGQREYCAGKIAQIFENIGGKVEYFGKPYPPVYKQAANIKNKKILCIGDNLNTDIKGANVQDFESILISNGVHFEEMTDDPNKLFKKYNSYANYIQSEFKW